MIRAHLWLNFLLIVIVGATLIDGSGGPPVRDSVVVLNGDSIVAVGPRGRVKIPPDARVIDARGMIVSPGFIDAHNHSDRGFETDPSAASQVSQGITTVVIGQDGGSPFPVGPYLSNLDQNPISLNVLTFVGHATLRTFDPALDPTYGIPAATLSRIGPSSSNS